MKVVKSYNAENLFISKFNNSIKKLQQLSNSIGNKSNLASPMSEFLGILTIAVLLWYGGYMVLVEKWKEYLSNILIKLLFNRSLTLFFQR